MAQKKLYYYKVKLLKNNIESDYHEILDLFQNVFREHANNRHLELIEESIQNSRVCMDIIENTKDYLFVRVSKSKNSNDFLRRDEDLNSKELILAERERIEMYTYFYYSYDAGVLSVLSNRSAANEKVFNQILKYDDEYTTELEPLPNKQSVRDLYNPNSTLSSVRIDIPVPDPEMLESVLEFDRDLIKDFAGTNVRSVRITFMAEPNKKISTENGPIKSIISKLLDLKRAHKISAARVKGKPATKLSQEYDLFAEFFSYPVTINTYRVENNERKLFTLDEVKEEVFVQMKMAYNMNKELIIELANRE